MLLLLYCIFFVAICVTLNSLSCYTYFVAFYRRLRIPNCCSTILFFFLENFVFVTYLFHWCFLFFALFTYLCHIFEDLINWKTAFYAIIGLQSFEYVVFFLCACNIKHHKTAIKWKKSISVRILTSLHLFDTLLPTLIDQLCDLLFFSFRTFKCELYRIAWIILLLFCFITVINMRIF